MVRLVQCAIVGVPGSRPTDDADTDPCLLTPLDLSVQAEPSSPEPPVSRRLDPELLLD